MPEQKVREKMQPEIGVIYDIPRDLEKFVYLETHIVSEQKAHNVFRGHRKFLFLKKNQFLALLLLGFLIFRLNNGVVLKFDFETKELYILKPWSITETEKVDEYYKISFADLELLTNPNRGIPQHQTLELWINYVICSKYFKIVNLTNPEEFFSKTRRAFNGIDDRFNILKKIFGSDKLKHAMRILTNSEA